jgi:hypothetical protein
VNVCKMTRAMLMSAGRHAIPSRYAFDPDSCGEVNTTAFIVRIRQEGLHLHQTTT